MTDIHPDMCMECNDEHGRVVSPNGLWTCRKCAAAMTNPTLSAAEVAELRALHEKATPGPWQAIDRSLLGTGVVAGDMDWRETGPLLACWSAGEIGADRADANAALIADMRNALPSLLSEVEAGRERLAALEAENRRMRGTLGYIAAQAKIGYPTVLSVIRANAEAAIDDDWQATLKLAQPEIDRQLAALRAQHAEPATYNSNHNSHLGRDLAPQPAGLDAEPATRAEDALVALPLCEWSEEYGDVLWWRFPIVEPPYVGSPLAIEWPGYHTHWTAVRCPLLPASGAQDSEGER